MYFLERAVLTVIFYKKKRRVYILFYKKNVLFSILKIRYFFTRKILKLF